MRVAERLVAIEGASERVGDVVQGLVRQQLALLQPKREVLGGAYDPLVIGISDSAPVATEAVRTEVKTLTDERNRLDEEVGLALQGINLKSHATAVLYEILRIRMPSESLDHVPKDGYAGKFYSPGGIHAPIASGDLMYLFQRGTVRKFTHPQSGKRVARVTFKPNDFTESAIALTHLGHGQDNVIYSGKSLGQVAISGDANPTNMPNDGLAVYGDRVGFRIDEPIVGEGGGFDRRNLRNSNVIYFSVSGPMVKAAKHVANMNPL
jgi:hypothetical protein